MSIQTGSRGNDTLIGGLANDELSGLDGDDRLDDMGDAADDPQEISPLNLPLERSIRTRCTRRQCQLMRTFSVWISQH